MTIHEQMQLSFGGVTENRASSEKTTTHEEARASVDRAKAHRTAAADAVAALTRIRDRGSYRATHESFESYAADRWGLTRDDLATLRYLTVTP